MFKYIILVLLFLSCDEFTEKDLYKSGDPEHAWLLQMAADKCVAEASIFNYLDEMKDFVGQGFLGNIYKVTQDKNPARTIYMYIYQTSATSMSVKLSSNYTSLNKILVFEDTDHNDLMDEIKVMACSSQYKEYFSAGGLSSTGSMTLTWKKQTTTADSDTDTEDDDIYNKRVDAYTFNSEYPLFFFYYNATKTTTSKATTSTTETPVESPSVITIAEISSDDCEDIDICDDMVDGTMSFTKTCNIKINTGLYSSNAFSDEILTTDDPANCILLPSAQ